MIGKGSHFDSGERILVSEKFNRKYITWLDVESE